MRVYLKRQRVSGINGLYEPVMVVESSGRKNCLNLAEAKDMVKRISAMIRCWPKGFK